MAMESRDWIMLAIGLGIGALVFSELGRQTIKTGVGVTKTEAERLLRKIEKRAKERAKK